MLKLVHVLATGLETGIGIWIFGQVFPERKSIGKKQYAAELFDFIWVMIAAHNFPAFYYQADKWKWFRPLLILGAAVLLGGYILNKSLKKQWGKAESSVTMALFFISTVICVSCQYWTNYQSYVAVALGNLWPVLFCFVLYECDFIQAYLWGFWYCTNIALLKMIYVTYIGTFLNLNFDEFLWSPRIHTYSESVYLLIICFVIIFFLKYISIEEILKKILNDRKIALFIVTLSEFYIFWLLLGGTKGGKIDEKNLASTLILVIGIVIILTLMLARSIGMASDKERRFWEFRNHTLEQQYQELNASYERYRRLVHDEKHRLTYLKECLDNHDIYSAQKFLEGCQNEMANSGRSFHTGIPTLDFILNIKKRKMDEWKVRFTMETELDEIPMEDADFVVLIGNLLDNAVEAVEKCPEEEREIQLSLRNINEMFVLQVRNSSSEAPQTKNHHFFTTKKEKENHGLGIESVKHIVEKYHGQIDFAFSESFFEVSIIINE